MQVYIRYTLLLCYKTGDVLRAAVFCRQVRDSNGAMSCKVSFFLPFVLKLLMHFMKPLPFMCANKI